MRNHKQSHGDERMLQHEAHRFHSTIQRFNTSTIRAFSLIEVVLAIGVVAFALVGIFSLFSGSLKTNKDGSAQQEGFEAPRILNSMFEATNFFKPADFTNLALLLYTNTSSNSSTNYFIYTSNNLGTNTSIITNNISSIVSTNYTGYLYEVVLMASSNTNTPIISKSTNVTVGPPPTFVRTTNIIYGLATLVMLPVHADVYFIPTPKATNTIKNSVPVLSFDFMISK